MFNDLIGERVNIVISSRSDNLLEYIGTLSSENEDTVELRNVDIYFSMLNIQKGIFGGDINKYKSNLEKVIINKKYVISCNTL